MSGPTHDIFRLLQPPVGECPVVVEVPHAGVAMDPVSMALCTAPVSSVARDADLYVDQLVEDCVREGATVLSARVSRYVIDLNRSPDDYDDRAVQGGRSIDRPFGLVWRETTDGTRTLTLPLSVSELQRRLDLFYRPYHDALENIVRRKKKRFGHVVVLSAHSMPTVSFHQRSPQPSLPYSDIVVGTRFGETATARSIMETLNHAQSFGWTVQRDEPFAGGATTVKYGRPDEGIEAIQVETARRLYMNERTLNKKPRSFDVVSSFWRGLVARLATTALDS